MQPCPLAAFALLSVLLACAEPIVADSLDETKQELRDLELESKVERGSGSGSAIGVGSPVLGHTMTRLGSGSSSNDNRQRNQRSIYSLGPRFMQISRSKIPIELDLLVESDGGERERSKRFDDYGHMRFGKRGGGEEQFDDYGHMRFGRKK